MGTHLKARDSVSRGAADINGGAWAAVSGMDAHARYADPAFTNEPAGDFHPSASSPSRDSGDCPHAPSPDLDGRPRPQGAGCDTGPYEAG